MPQTASIPPTCPVARRRVRIAGIVQGVGFRPFVHGIATRLGLTGSVCNEGGGVTIEVQGRDDLLDRFVDALDTETPPLAVIRSMQWDDRDPVDESDFRIDASSDSAAPVFFPPDIAACADCLREMSSPSNRRYGYPFLNCTHCGPRFTIVLRAPYDRQNTTLRAFEMCDACRREYDDPRDRRFHAQATACPNCGPRLRAFVAGRLFDFDDPLAETAAMVKDGGIAAIKGLGGYHLCCDAARDAAVERLRSRKHREEKPFAVMVRDIDAAARLCAIDPAERALLESAHRPIVLLRRLAGAPIANAVAFQNPRLGVMLPYTPLHHLLLQAVDGRPLVMTSGNISDEPIAHEDADALQRLGPIADIVLAHNRPIHVRCDDSVATVVGGKPQMLRRSRGYAPAPIGLAIECRAPILAVGAQQKNVFALGRGNQAILSHHIGDLDHYAAYRAFQEAVPHFERLFGIKPEKIAHDLHPEYLSTHFAMDSALPCVGVQHHHAHMAACMAENALDGTVIGVTLDGSGYGPDGTIWGGEFLVGGYETFERVAHFRCIGLPGGESAIREPWRMALACALDAGAGVDEVTRRFGTRPSRWILGMIEKHVNCPTTSSCGRYFDAVGALLGGRAVATYEGQAAVELEWLATTADPDGAYSFGVDDSPQGWIVDPRPAFREIVAALPNDPPAQIARRWHAGISGAIVEICQRIRAARGLGTVVLSGGCFMNRILSSDASHLLAAAGFEVHQHHLVPCNDGGLSLGQLAVAAAQTRREGHVPCA